MELFVGGERMIVSKDYTTPPQLRPHKRQDHKNVTNVDGESGQLGTLTQFLQVVDSEAG